MARRTNRRRPAQVPSGVTMAPTMPGQRVSLPAPVGGNPMFGIPPIAAGVPESQIPAMTTGGRNGGRPAGDMPLGPPPGTYDPQLDASLRASERGLDDFLFDTRRAGQRSNIDYRVARQDAAIARTRGRNDLASAIERGVEDYQVQRGDVGREWTRGVEDVATARDRGFADLGTARTTAQQDAQTAKDVLTRNYSILGDQQRQQAAAAGMGMSGAGAQAAAKRQANQAYEQKPIDTSLARALAQIGTSESRLSTDSHKSMVRLNENRDRSMQGLNTQGARQQEDFATQGRRMEQDFRRVLGPQGSPRSGSLYMQYNRGVEDRQEAERRAREEARNFGQDIASTQYYQARFGAGTLPIWRPSAGGPRRRDEYAPPRRPNRNRNRR